MAAPAAIFRASLPSRPSAARAATVELVRDLRSLSAQWEALACSAIEPNPFYEPWMLQPALEASPTADACFAIVRAASGDLIGLFPLQRCRSYKGIPVGTWTSWRDAHSLLCTPLVHAEAAHEAIAALLDWARGSLVEFRYIPVDGGFHHALAAVLNERGSTPLVVSQYVRGMLRKLPAGKTFSMDEHLSRQMKKTLRRRQKRLQELGTVSHVLLRPGDDPAPWIEGFLALEASGWKGQRGSALASSAANRSFAQRVFREAFERGRLMMIGLDLDGRPIARQLCLLSGDGAFAFKTAYDEAYASVSPGVLVQLDNVAHFHGAMTQQWMDSCTGENNLTLDTLWHERRTVQTLAVGCGGWGGLAAASLPLLRWMKQAAHASKRKSGAETSP